MRQTCQISFKSEEYGIDWVCGKPAVDYAMRNDEKFWLCAQHWDLMERIHKLLREQREERGEHR